MLGCEEGDKELIKYQSVANIKNEFDKVVQYWNDKLSILTVKTPDEAFDYVINGWYLYQTYVSRLIARAGFYQVGGAIGFRDQLQDCMAVMYTNPKLTRNKF